MKTKFLTFLLALVCSTTLFASNVIIYTATEKLPETNNYSWFGCLYTPAFNVSISSHTFSNGTGTITFAGEVTLIGNDAFHGCSGLTSITIPNSVTSIGNDAFHGCSGLTSITIPNSVTSIGNNAFYDCRGLTSPVYNANCFAYMPSSFHGKYIIVDGIKQISGGAFDGCSGLTSITIPNSVTTIGEGAFRYCNGLTSPVYNANCFAYMPTSYTGVYTIPNGITQIAGWAFHGCSGLTSVTIPNSVSTIGDYAFARNTFLTEVILGANLKEIGHYAFDGDYRIESITSYAIITPNVNSYAFSGLSKGYIYLYVPEESIRKYQVDPNWNKFDIKTKSASTTVVTNDSVIITPSSNEATFTWPVNDQANGYSLEIKKDGEVFCTLKFNSSGQLTGIAFAPSRNGRHNAPAAIMTTSGWQFTVTGLETASRYNYTLDVTDAAQSKIKTYSGTFATDGYTALENIQTNASTTKFLRDGQLYIQRNGIIYDARGARIE